MWQAWVLGAAVVLAGLAYVAWEFRWYLTTLWRASTTDPDWEATPDRAPAREPERDLAARPH